MMIKICGIMSAAAAHAVRDCGADLIGFVFAPGKRRMDAASVRQIAAGVSGIAKAGVFVNAPSSEVLEVARECRLDYIQLHGDEPPEYCLALGLPVIKAVRWQTGANPAQTGAYSVDWLLMDSYAGNQYGGTGETFNWLQAKPFRDALTQPVIVAGGLHPDNVADAIRALRPDGVDVSSGVETDGVKDPEKIAAFITAVRSAQGGDLHA
jgi:phosphoribosylanthranilate isomerase